MQLLFSFIIWFLIGAATAYFAQQRGRDPFIWFMIGMFLGLLGMLLVFILPSLEETEEHDSEGHEEHIEEIPPSFLPTKAHDYLIKEWFYLDPAHHQQGPCRFEVLKEKWGQGNLSNISYVWCEGMNQWEKIEDIPDLKEALLAL